MEIACTLYSLLEGGGKSGDAGKALFRVFSKGTQYYDIDASRQGFIKRAGRLWWSTEVHKHHLFWSTAKRWAPCKEFICHYSEGVLVCCQYRLPAPLLRSHVGWGTTR